MLRRAPVVLAVALLVVGACGSGDDDTQADRPDDVPATTTTASATSSTSTTLAPVTSGAPTTVPEAEADGVLVELTSSGGLDGRGSGGLLVTSSGQVTATGRSGQVAHDTLAPDELDALADLLAATDFAALAGGSGNTSTCADAFVYVVRYRQWTATADDCATPIGLAPVLDRLQDILTRVA